MDRFEVRVRCKHGRKMWAPAHAFALGVTDLVDACAEAKEERIIAQMERDLASPERRTFFRFWRRER